LDKVFLGSFGTRIILLAVGFLTSVTLARLFGAAAVGEMSLVVALLVLTSHISLFGSQTTILKRLPVRDYESQNETLGPAFLTTSVLGIAVGIILLILDKLGMLGSYAQLGNSFIFLLPAMVLANAYRVLALETLRGLQKIRTYNAVSPLVAISILVAVISVYLAGGKYINLPIIIFTTEIIFLVIVGTLFLRIPGRPRVDFRFGRAVLFRYVRVSFIFFLSGSSIIIGQLDVLVAGYFLPVGDVGVYAISVRLAALVGLVLASANISFAPNVAGIFQNEGIHATLSLARAQTRMIVPLTAAMGFFVAATGYFFLGVFGSPFLAAYPALLILIAGQVLAVLFGPVGIFLNMTMGQRDMLIVTLGALGAGLLSTYLLIPDFGLTGAALANLLTLVVRNLLATIFIYRRTGTAISVFHAWRGQ